MSSKRTPRPDYAQHLQPADWLAYIRANEQMVLDEAFGASPYNRRSGFYVGENRRPGTDHLRRVR